MGYYEAKRINNQISLAKSLLVGPARTRTRTRTNTNPYGREANAAGRFIGHEEIIDMPVDYFQVTAAVKGQ